MASLDFMHESSRDLKQLLRQCVEAPLYVKADESKHFVAFLLSLNAQLADELLPIIHAQIPLGHRSVEICALVTLVLMDTFLLSK